LSGALSPEVVAALRTSFRTLFYSKLLREDALQEVLDEHGAIPSARLSISSALRAGVVSRTVNKLGIIAATGSSQSKSNGGAGRLRGGRGRASR